MITITGDGRHCVFALHAHLVFVTKYRRKVFTANVLNDMRGAVCGGVWGLRGGACRDRRRRRSRASAGELSAESPALAAGEQPQRRIEPPPSPDASRFASALLQGCSVVAQLLRRLVWRRADQHHPPIHPTTTSTGLELIPAQTRLAPISGLNARACGAKIPVNRFFRLRYIRSPGPCVCTGSARGGRSVGED